MVAMRSLNRRQTLVGVASGAIALWQAVSLPIALAAEPSGGQSRTLRPTLCRRDAKRLLEQHIQEYIKALEHKSGREFSSQERSKLVDDIFEQYEPVLAQTYAFID